MKWLKVQRQEEPGSVGQKHPRMSSRHHCLMADYASTAASSSLSSMEAFFRSSAASSAPSFSCSSSASAEAEPLTAWFFWAGLRAASKVPFAPSPASSSASRRSISFCALATFYIMLAMYVWSRPHLHSPPWSCGPGHPSRTQASPSASQR